MNHTNSKAHLWNTQIWNIQYNTQLWNIQCGTQLMTYHITHNYGTYKSYWDVKEGLTSNEMYFVKWSS